MLEWLKAWWNRRKTGLQPKDEGTGGETIRGVRMLSIPWWTLLLAALIIAVVLIAALAAAVDGRAGRKEAEALIEARTYEVEALKSEARKKDKAWAVEKQVLQGRIAVAEAKEGPSVERLAAARRRAAIPWARPPSEAALVDRFGRLGYRGVIR